MSAVPDCVTHPKKFTIFGWGLSPRVLPSSISRERLSLCVSAVFPTEGRETCYELPTVPCCLFVCLFVCLFIPAQKHGCMAKQRQHIQNARIPTSIRNLMCVYRKNICFQIFGEKNTPYSTLTKSNNFKAELNA